MRRLTILLTVLAALCAFPSTVFALSTTDKIYKDCEYSPTGLLRHTYTKGQLNNALKNPPGDVNEYSGCHDAIRQQLLGSGSHTGSGGTNGSGGSGGGAHGGAGGSGSGGSDPIAHATANPPGKPHVGTKAPVQLAGSTIQPGAVPAFGRSGHTLPTPLIVFLVLLGVGALVGTSTTIGRRVVARRRA